GGAIALAIGKGGSFVRSTDSGATWTNPIQTSPAALLNGIAYSGATVIAAGAVDVNSNIIYSTDQGTTWFTGVVAADPKKNLNDVALLSATNAVAVGQNTGGTSTVLRTTNSGATWSVRPVTGDPGKELLAVASSGSGVVAVGKNAGGTSTVLRSGDSGASWNLQAVAGDPGQQLNAVAFSTGANVIAVGKAGVILRSTNGGVAWAVMGAVTGNELKDIAIDANDATRVLAVGKNGTIVRSTDSGATWAVVGAAVTGSNLNSAVFSDNTAIAVGDGGTIVRSTNGGATWFAEASSTGNNLNDAIFNGNTGAILIGDAGTIRQSAPTPSVLPTSLAFGSVNVGVSASLAVTVNNTGIAPLTVSSITSSDGEFVPDITNFVLATGASQIVNVTFTPTSAGARAASLTITHSGVPNPITVSMSGTGTGTSIGLSTGSLGFGNVVTLASKTLPVTVTNSGGANLVVTNITSDDGQFAPDVTNFTVLPGGTRVVNVTFTSVTPGSKSGTLTLTHNAFGGTSTVSVAGDATVGFATPLGLDFGHVELAGNASLPVVLSNPSAVPLTVTSVVSSNPAFVPDLSTFVIAPGGNQVVNVSFEPAETGTHSALLSVTHNPTVTMAMGGVGGDGVDVGVPEPANREKPLTIVVPFGGEFYMGLLVGAYGLCSLWRRDRHPQEDGADPRAGVLPDTREMT
ncbi:MAG: DUF1573 domain-containing protein, partial [Gemmatimonadetes bacterium]|nr:DUF1573 domain-containing protein [Gemmatimonadota bacterium]